MKRQLILAAFFSMIFMFAEAQAPFPVRQRAKDSKGLVYDREKIYYIRPHTNGLALGFSIGKAKTYYKTKYMAFEIGYLRHPKETRQSGDSNISPTTAGAQTSSSFILGKQNSLYNLRMGWGTKVFVSDKASYRGVAVGYSYEFGPMLGLVKPYYLDIQFSNDANPVPVKFTEATRSVFLDNYSGNIIGASSFSKGWNEVKILPGVHAKTALHFDFASTDEYIRALECGVMLDLYPKKVPIMIEAENRPFFLNVFANIMLGKRK